MTLAVLASLAYAGRGDQPADRAAIEKAVVQLCSAPLSVPSTVAVGGILDAASKASEFSTYVADKLTASLVNEGRTRGFTVVERASVAELAKEWALGQSGMVDERTAAAAGALSGAGAFVFGSYARVVG